MRVCVIYYIQRELYANNILKYLPLVMMALYSLPVSTNKNFNFNWHNTNISITRKGGFTTVTVPRAIMYFNHPPHSKSPLYRHLTYWK